MPDNKRIITEGTEKDYNASDLTKRYKKEEKREVVTERKFVTSLRRAWNVCASTVLLLLASLGVYCLCQPALRSSLVNIFRQFLSEIGL